MIKKEYIYIDDTPMDFSDVEPMSDEEYEKHRENVRKYVESQKQNNK